MKIAINGAGIAGPTLAYWLRKSGHEVLLIEQAPKLRDEGYVVDFWGLGYDIAERMGVLPRVLAAGYQVKEVRFVDADGRETGGFSVDVFGRIANGRFTTLRRSDLAAALYDALDDGVETIFGDSIASIHEERGGVHITFDHAAARDVDLVVGADGQHSRVRQLAFGAESAFEVPLGYHVAAFQVRGYRPRAELEYVTYGVPGRQLSRFAMRNDTTLFLGVLRDEYMTAAMPRSDGERKAVIAHVFSGLGWECAQIVAAMDEVDEIYFDRVSQIRMDGWTKGRVALLGDAGACVSLLAGEGAGLAMAGAYLLAGELSDDRHDYHSAFARYQERMMPLVKRKQASAAKFASSFAPKSAFGIRFRNFATKLMRLPFAAQYFIGRDLSDTIELPDYGM